MMWRQDRFSYLETEAVQAVALPYADQRFELVLILARAGAPAAKPSDVLTSEFADRQGQVFLASSQSHLGPRSAWRAEPYRACPGAGIVGRLRRGDKDAG